MVKNGTVVVVGGVNTDIGGTPYSTLRQADSNPGRVRISVGGVGRNIAHNLRLLGVPVTLLTAYGDDAHGCLVEESCALAGIDLSRARKIKGGDTPAYLFITDEKGDMRLAVADMEICERISPAYMEENRALLQSAAAVVFDTNIPESTVRWLSDNCTSPLFADPVSAAKSVKLRGVLSKLHALKPNRLEAETLSGVAIHSEKDIYAAADVLLQTGLQELYLSDGEGGVYAFDHSEKYRIPCLPAKTVSATGAGDAFVAGLVKSYLDGASLYERALTASAAAAVAVESGSTVNPALSMEAIKIKIKTFQGE